MISNDISEGISLHKKVLDDEIVKKIIGRPKAMISFFSAGNKDEVNLSMSCLIKV